LSEAEINRMPIDELLQNPVWASVYRRGWQKRTMDIQNPSRQPADGEFLLRQTPDAQVEVAMASGEPCTPVKVNKVNKVKTEAQQVRSHKNLLKLKEKKKARKQLKKKQHPEPISDPEAAS